MKGYSEEDVDQVVDIQSEFAQDQSMFGDQDQSTFADQDQCLFGDQDQSTFADQDQCLFGDQDQSTFADQDQSTFGDQDQDASVDHMYPQATRTPSSEKKSLLSRLITEHTSELTLEDKVPEWMFRLTSAPGKGSPCSTYPTAR
jgi:hypothetical protein